MYCHNVHDRQCACRQDLHTHVVKQACKQSYGHVNGDHFTRIDCLCVVPLSAAIPVVLIQVARDLLQADVVLRHIINTLI